VASQLMNKPELFKRTAKFWTQYFGNSNIDPPDESFSKLINKLKDMGIEEVRLFYLIILLHFRNKH
jgi:intein-encoded DNA endonuclease-like protein